MFGNPGGAASADWAHEAFEDDIAASSRQVGPAVLLELTPGTQSPRDRQ
jgi:hypothetical protein